MTQRAPTSEANDEAQRLAAGHTRLQWLMEFSGIVVFFALTPWLIMQLHGVSAGLSTLATVGLSVGALFAGLITADFISGLVHWGADNWGSPDWPILGAGFIRPFRHHHLDPEEMCRHGFVEMNGNNCLVSIPVFFVASFVLSFFGGATGFFLSAWLLSLAWWVFGTNQFHAWTHTDNPPAVARFLQGIGLILRKKNHDVHHQAPHNTYYCITSGWLNPVLTRLHFFEFLELTITGITRIKPFHWEVARQKNLKVEHAGADS